MVYSQRNVKFYIKTVKLGSILSKCFCIPVASFIEWKYLFIINKRLSHVCHTTTVL